MERSLSPPLQGRADLLARSEAKTGRCRRVYRRKNGNSASGAVHRAEPRTRHGVPISSD